MISKALPQEKKIVYVIWKQVFAGDDGGYTDYFFRTLYKPENTLVLKDSGNIVSTLMRIPHSIMLAGHVLETSMILGVATIPSYRKRTKEDFDHLQEECNAEGGKLIAYYDQNKQIQGYASLYQTAQGIEVRECIYLNSVALFKLLNLALQLKPEIILHTTQDEHLEKIIQGLTWQDYGFTMARINDYDLFNRLYGSAVTSPKEAFALSGKPLFMHEYA